MARNPVRFMEPKTNFDALYQWRWPNGFPLTVAMTAAANSTAASSNSAIAATARPDHRRHHLRFHQTGAHRVVPSHLPHDPGQERGLGDEAAPPSGHLLQRGVAHQHKLMQVMMERDREHPLSGWIELDDAYLGGERSGGKRGRGAPGKTPFVAAVQTNEQGHPLRMKLTVRGLPSHRNRRLGAAPPRYRHSGRLRRVGLLSWRHRRGLRS